ncbi:Cell division protein FtsI [Peptidoglycan synthetase] [hydrothermal vent metagenome]|uniref:Cell division protein FtsI [Peptidoglycan synthetase] n=1 Tax=hydrothermal vent metagenome TaxID=652676 RepID=A0A3B1AVF6_9ZZZZ
MRSADLHIEGVKYEAIEVARNRLMVPAFLFILGFGILAVRLVSIGIFEDISDQVTRAQPATTEIVQERIDILDRNGVVLATNLSAPSLAVRPRLIMGPEEVADKIVAVLPDLNRTRVLNKLKSSHHFLYIKRNLTPKQVWHINALGYPGLILEQAEKRIYPQGNLASHVLGYVDVENKPQAGVEKFFNDHLSNTVRSNEPLYLSLDIRVQHIVRQELAFAMNKFSAIGGAGMVMDINTGEVLAMTSLPDFDGNGSVQPASSEMKNRNILEPYEMGSGFKAFTIAMALDSGTVTLNDVFDATEPLKVGRRTINDDHAKERILNVPEIFTFSSNIGSSLIIREVGVEQQKNYLQKFGLFEKSVVELTGLSRPILPAHWGEIQSMTVSYGHGIAVTPLHLVAGISAMINGGRLIPATLIRKDTALDDEYYPQVISPETSQKMRHLMRLAVEYGSGSRAHVKGYLVGGKTGTAEKVVNGKYSRQDKITSFVGVFPMDNPKYVVFAMLDEPKGIEETFYKATGGWVAAPVVAEIIKKIGPLLGVLPREYVETKYQNLILVDTGK